MKQDAEFIRHQYLVNKIKELNTYYYQGNPEVSDAEFDALYMEMKALESKLGLAEDQLTSQVVGHVENTFLDQHLHRRPMLSLQTEVDSSEQGFIAFDARVRRDLMIPVGEAIDYISEMKFDGLGLNLQYNKGVLIKILTRGDGEVGENVTHSLPLFGDSIVVDISQAYPFDIEIRGEAMMTKEDFQALNQSLEESGQRLMANPRNAAAGTVRTLDLEKIKHRKMVFFPYAVGDYKGPGLGGSHSETMDRLFQMGFSIFNGGGFKSKTFGSPSDLGPYSFFKSLETKRDKLDIEIDGVVHKVDRLDLQEQLGFRSREPRWAVAQKFPPIATQTKLYAIDVQVGRTGKLTPVARVMPVQVGGVVVSNATLHNLFDLRRRGVRVGDTVTIQRAGDVIPEIAYRMDTKPREAYAPNFHFPKVCPSCGSPITRPKGEVAYYCTGKDKCPEQIIGSLLHFSSRRAMDIQGLGESTITTLVNKGIFKNYLDIYNVSVDVYAVQGEMGYALAQKLMKSLNDSKRNYEWQFLHGLGIKEVGERMSKLICKVHSLKILRLTESSAVFLRETIGLGPSASEHIARYFSNEDNMRLFDAFLSLPGLTLKKSDQPKGDGAKDMLVVFTGSFLGYSRDQLKSLVESNGGKTSSSVSSKTTHVVTGDQATQHKVDKAKSLNIPVLSMEEFKIAL